MACFAADFANGRLNIIWMPKRVSLVEYNIDLKLNPTEPVLASVALLLGMKELGCLHSVGARCQYGSKFSCLSFCHAATDCPVLQRGLVLDKGLNVVKRREVRNYSGIRKICVVLNAIPACQEDLHRSASLSK